MLWPTEACNRAEVRPPDTVTYEALSVATRLIKGRGERPGLALRGNPHHPLRKGGSVLAVGNVRRRLPH